MPKRLLILLCALVLYSHPSWALERALEPITLQLKWQHQFQFAGYYAAIRNGYFKDEGLNVTLRVPKAGEDPAELVAAGVGEYGIGSSELVVSRHKGLPIVALAAVYQHSPFAIASLKSSSIRTIHDLAGKRLMLEPQAAEMWAYMRSEGIPTNTLQLKEHTFNTESLISGEVDAMSVYATDEPYTLDKLGIPYQMFDARSAGIDFYGEVLFTTEQEIAQNPRRVAAFLRAARRGWYYALNHAEEVANWIYQDYSQAKSVEQLLYEAKHSIPLIRPDLVEWGYMSPGRWKHIGETYHKLGMLDDTWNLDGFLYDPSQKDENLANLYRLLLFVVVALVLVAVVGGRFYVLNTRLTREVHKRQEAENRAHDALHETRNLLAIMAHDFRSPVNVILAATQLIEVVLPEQSALTQRELHKIKGAVQSLETLINSCLTWDRLEGAHHGDHMRLDMVKLVKQVVERHQEMDPERPMQSHFPDGSVMIHGSPTLLAVLVGNLLDNASKYSPQGASIDLLLQVVKDKVELRVKDQGPGLSVDQLEQVFDKYYRCPAAPSGSGSGIGLNAVRQIAVAHGGTVQAEAGVGGCFVVSLPRIEELS
ncbi:histidine kinase [Magnetococcus marinus MC-1]|uniref:histidine kinase n=1 Tax=Magnetococcus marinus (strain ATCC BAA-1437 / JCM 17883 / MC-1) TaxID=156889 RepID=A0LD30_MAGMM|nr:ABC transporter substrate-binding protein [Magnetococcus marinus]ABK45873.1 histidine kinase [Magnetococcus marinus MC-1]